MTNNIKFNKIKYFELLKKQKNFKIKKISLPNFKEEDELLSYQIILKIKFIIITEFTIVL